jgi:hypothetical protein
VTTEVQFAEPVWAYHRDGCTGVEVRAVAVSTEAGDTITVEAGGDVESISDSRHNFWTRKDGRWEAVSAQPLIAGIDSVTVTRRG